MSSTYICWLTDHCGLWNVGECVGVELEFKLEVDRDGVSSRESSFRVIMDKSQKNDILVVSGCVQDQEHTRHLGACGALMDLQRLLKGNVSVLNA